MKWSQAQTQNILHFLRADFDKTAKGEAVGAFCAVSSYGGDLLFFAANI